MLPSPAAPARGLTVRGRTFSRSYGTILPSSFTWVLSSASEYSSRPPVSVSGTATVAWSLGAFPGSLASSAPPPARGARRHVSGLRARICLSPLPTRLNRDVQHPAAIASSVTPSQQQRYRNINLFSIGYAFRPRLRYRLTLRRLTLRRKPWAFGGGVFHPPCRYLCQHSHFR